MVTLQDIADRVGVTRTVVSYVLADRLGKIRVSEARREEILRVAAELGYVANRSARALVTRRSRTLGLIVNYRRFEKLTTVAYATMFNVLEGMRSVGSQAGYQCVHAVADLRSETIFETPDFIRERSVDAVAVYGYMHQSVSKQILATGLPCLHIGTNIESGSGICNVSADMDGAACRALDHAVAAGVGSAHLYLPNGPGPQKIADVFLKYAAKNHPRLKATAKLGRESVIHYEEALRHGERLGKQPPSLVFASITDVLPLLIGLKSYGLCCPDDVELLAFASEGFHQERLGDTGLLVSQIILPYSTVGEVVARQLIELLEGGQTKLRDARIDCLFEPGETAPSLFSPCSPSTQQQPTHHYENIR